MMDSASESLSPTLLHRQRPWLPLPAARVPRCLDVYAARRHCFAVRTAVGQRVSRRAPSSTQRFIMRHSGGSSSSSLSLHLLQSSSSCRRVCCFVKRQRERERAKHACQAVMFECNDTIRPSSSSAFFVLRPSSSLLLYMSCRHDTRTFTRLPICVCVCIVLSYFNIHQHMTQNNTRKQRVERKFECDI